MIMTSEMLFRSW